MQQNDTSVNHSKMIDFLHNFESKKVENSVQRKYSFDLMKKNYKI